MPSRVSPEARRLAKTIHANKGPEHDYHSREEIMRKSKLSQCCQLEAVLKLKEKTI